MLRRKLTEDEIVRLEHQGCSAVDWSDIEIDSELQLKYVRNVRFSGHCSLGKFTKSFSLAGGMSKHSGVYQATLHNVTIADNCCVENINNYIANYDIEEDCYIENVDIILVDGVSTFGNGIEVSVLNETGGREVTIHNKLSAHEAYIEAMYRHRPVLIDQIKAFAKAQTEKMASSQGRICKNSTIIDTGVIKNMFIGEYSSIIGAGRLNNGSLCSKKESPIHIGHGVMADDFIVQDGSDIEDGTMLTRCYVGQSCTMGHGYSASDSLFFCNCQEENGEACAIFAGPFTVTHHKSTLLIAGMFSFMNAGSGSNQSNHMYKLGPIHQGALERGAKTTSDSYILWPARVGAFSLVMGRHTSHPDTSKLPFSYLIENDGVSYLVPGVNLRSVGTVRDAQKWPKRDKRAKEGRIDQINYNLLSPYTISKMVQGLEILNQLKTLSGATSDTYTYQSARIKSSSLEHGIGLYTLAINKFLGNSLISRLEKSEQLKPESPVGEGVWVDLSGLIAPKTCITEILNDIENGKISSSEELNERFAYLHRNYYDLEWAWAYRLMISFYGLDESNITNEDLIRIIKIWKESVVSLDQMLYNDAKKEFNLTSKTGFGFDGHSNTAEADFEHVRGQFDTNPFVLATEEHIKVKSALGDKWISKLENK